MLSLKHIAAYLILAGAIKVWQPGEDVVSTDLNANFNHIHTKMVGGHGARLVDADVNASANIANSKLAAYRYIPKAWLYIQASCGSSPCTVAAQESISGVTRVSAGSYVVTLNYTATNTNFAAIVGLRDSTIFCAAAVGSTTQVNVTCKNSAGAATDTAFNLVVFDDD